MKLIGLMILMMGSVALASDAGHEANHIPIKAISIQGANFLGLLILMVYFLKKPIKNLFAERGEKYHAHLTIAQKAKEDAEEEKKIIKDRLDSLHATAGESVEQAKADAQELRHKIIEDAKYLAEKLELEANRTVKYESEKAKAMIRQELISMALKSSKDELVNKMNPEEQQRLENEFIEKIQVVQS